MAISTLEIADHVAFEFRRFYFLTQVPILGHLTFWEKRNASRHIQVCASEESDPCSLEGVDEIVVALLELALIKDFLAAMLYSARHNRITVDYFDFHMLPPTIAAMCILAGRSATGRKKLWKTRPRWRAAGAKG